jgi:TRAP-type C4-dicarboxylate transport system substrate-binding protein
MRRSLPIRLLLSAIILAAAVSGRATPAWAEEILLRVHHFLPVSSTTHKDFIAPWAEAIEAQSGGRIRIEIYPSMQLGGKPPQLFDQVRDGVVDVAWTLAGYTPGRFPKLEVLELPFVPGTAKATSAAAHAFYEAHARDELASVHPLMVHVHGPGVFHMRNAPIRTLEDLAGKKIRVPSRPINEALNTLDATPVGMPAPAVAEAITRGVVDGAVLPYEVTVSLRVHELTNSHTELVGERGLYTAVFLFLMNKERYEALPDDLKSVMDANAGIPLALQIGAVWDEAEDQAREATRALGDEIITIEGAEYERWKTATQPVIDQWVAERTAAGDDGQALLDAARELIAQYSAAP